MENKLMRMPRCYWTNFFKARRLRKRGFAATERLVERGSTKVVLVGDPLLSRAMTWIRDHACDGILVADVVEAMSCSRSLARFSRDARVDAAE